jgi:hypothetical protein
MQRFREERRTNMREEWQGLALFVGIVVACVYWIAFHDGFTQTLAAFLLGATTTTLGFGWMLGFDARSLRWAWGAWGEQWTAEELQKLDPTSWSIYQDLPDGRGNWDHIVVGGPACS